MGLVPDFEYDLFISYAHIDNGSGQWVSTLLDELRDRINELEGKRAVKIWIDYEQIKGNLSLIDQLKEGAKNSAVLLVVVSEGYLNSDWCTQEYQWFHKEVAARRISNGNVFAVFKAKRREDPRFKDKFGDLVGFDFWDSTDRSDNPLPLEKSNNEKVFNTQLFNLLKNLKTQIERFRVDSPPLESFLLDTDDRDNERKAEQFIGKRFVHLTKARCFTRLEVGDEPPYVAWVKALRRCRGIIITKTLDLDGFKSKVSESWKYFTTEAQPRPGLIVKLPPSGKGPMSVFLPTLSDVYVDIDVDKANPEAPDGQFGELDNVLKSFHQRSVT